MSYNENKELCTDLNKAAQPSEFQRYTGTDKEHRDLRKEAEATKAATNEREWVQAIIAHQLG